MLSHQKLSPRIISRFSYILLFLLALIEHGAIAEEDLQFPFSFVVVGDIPYGKRDYPVLNAVKEKIITEKPPFVIHLGDYKSSRNACSKRYDDDFSKFIEQLKPIPTIYTPGDNEWTDCDKHNNTSEIQRLKKIRDSFLKEGIIEAPGLNLERQKTPIQDNTSWQYQGVHFITLHVVSTSNGRRKIFSTIDTVEEAIQLVEQRDKANLEWLRSNFKLAEKTNAHAFVIAFHADIFRNKLDDCKSKRDADCDAYINLRKNIFKEAEKFKKPVLLIHGDTPEFTLDQPKNLLPHRKNTVTSDNVWRINAAGDAFDNDKVRDATLVTIDSNNEKRPFQAELYTKGTRAN